MSEVKNLQKWQNNNPELQALLKGEKNWGNMTPSSHKDTLSSASMPPGSVAPLTYAEKMKKQRKVNSELIPENQRNNINIAREGANAENVRRMKESYNRYIRRGSRRNDRSSSPRPRYYTRRRSSSRERNNRGRYYSRRRSSSRERNNRGRYYSRRRSPSPRRRSPPPRRRSPSPRERNNRGRYYSRRSRSPQRNNHGRFTRRS